MVESFIVPSKADAYNEYIFIIYIRISKYEGSY